MEVGINNLARTYTDSSHSRLNNSSHSSVQTHHQSHTGSSYSTYSHPSRSSNSTQDTSASALFPQPPSSNTPPGASPANPTNNVINRVADKSTSLFQSCMTLRNRLRAVPGFEDEVAETEELAEEDEDDPEPMDPVTLLWRTFRRGYPLMTIYNALDPDVPLSIDEGKLSEVRRSKAAAFKFLQACVHVLNFSTQDCFILSDLYGEDTSGFVKVAKVVSRVVDMLEASGRIVSFDGAGQPQGTNPTSEKRTQRQHIVDELVRTERTYVQHLEILHSFKKLVEQRGVIPGDAIHDIFLNLNALLDFQRRFLIRVEQINAMPEDQQDWGKEFYRYSSAFRVYEQYIANQKNCEETAMREYDKLREVGGSSELQQLVESPTHLTAFLLKPFQRLSKYPLLLKELRDKGDLDEDRRNTISAGIDAITAVLERTNTFIAQQERAEAVQNLTAQVEDWKEHRIESFGELLLHGVFTVFKTDSTKSEREYRMYLFEKILLCCKDITDKPKGKIMNNKAPAAVPSRSKPKMAMKGRIFMQNVTETTFLSKPGHYTCQISWRGEGSVIGNFVVKFPTEEILKQWRDLIEKQRKLCTEQAHRHFARSNSTTDFNYAQQQRFDNEDGAGYEDHGYGNDDQLQQLNSRHGSSGSLRSRSTTGDSVSPMGPPQGRGPPTKYSGGGPPLTLRTRELQNAATSGASYFSPVAESPISSRTSSSSGLALFPRQTTPQNGWHGDESNRFTAPAHMNRAIGKDPHHNVYYQADPRTGRPVQMQSLPPHQASLAQTRLRSASTPDVHSQNGGPRNVASNAPPVPNVPGHVNPYATGENRSQSNSPLYGNAVAPPPPPRGAVHSSSSGRLQEVPDEDEGSARDSQDYHDESGQQFPEAGHRRWESGTMSPPRPSTEYSSLEGMGPTSYQVVVNVPTEGQTLRLIASYNISFQSLIDRIDAKLQRSTNLSLNSGRIRLQYEYDDEMVNIQTDEDVQTAFEETGRDPQRLSSEGNPCPVVRLWVAV